MRPCGCLRETFIQFGGKIGKYNKVLLTKSKKIAMCYVFQVFQYHCHSTFLEKISDRSYNSKTEKDELCKRTEVNGSRNEQQPIPLVRAGLFGAITHCTNSTVGQIFAQGY